jgi:hypothetical protein
VGERGHIPVWWLTETAAMACVSGAFHQQYVIEITFHEGRFLFFMQLLNFRKENIYF